MDDLKIFLQEIQKNSGIQFKISSKNGKEIYASASYSEDCSNVYRPLTLGKEKFLLKIDKKYEVCSKLLIYSIENKYNEMRSMRYKELVDILDGKSININKELNGILSSSSAIFIVNLNSDVYDGLNIINQMYNENKIISFIYKSEIIIVGDFEDVYEHAVSIREAMISNLFCKCIVSFVEIAKGKLNLKDDYEKARESLIFKKIFSLKDEVIDYNKLFFEKIVYYIETNLKREILHKFKEKFDSFDSEMLNTIEEFVNNGLNISSTAKKLYIHRNTLIYRIDKIKKETGFDIKNFKEAAVFIIAFLIWKEYK
ncbi:MULTISPECIES: PucR family transcriptional regulator [Clostridium]|uniref:PucR family transcriptional regulator n=1 Tax=Clostridium TaxID=1485 RepID=UPI000826C7CC|nr:MULTISPECIES: helix-turn-helix domain-containing protein [Clostridium]PJI08764.1 PucR family transcriptional regulator [Clostridium sp. CT7]